MRTRWIIAAVAALGLAGVVAGTVIRMRTPPLTARACSAESKPADLSFTMKDLGGADVTLSSFKGNVLLLNFWATWCGPCKVEIPAFVEFQKRYGDDGLKIVGVSIDDTVEKLQPYVKDMNINYPILQGLGHDEVQDAFGPMMAIPVTVVISRDGKICATHTGLTSKEEFERDIKALL